MSTRKPQALYVYVHPDERSFNRQLFDAGRAALGRTHEVVTSDLYAMGFEPTLSRADLGDFAHADDPFLARWGRAYADGQLPADVRIEQQKLLDADLVVFQFPLWWYSIPAMLKGWFDRVFASGFGFDVIDPTTGLPRKYGDGVLVGKRALISVSLGEGMRSIAPRGISGDIDTLLFSLTHGTLFYAGMEPLPIHVIADADDLGPDGVGGEIQRFTARIAGLAEEAPTPYRTMLSGDYRPGRTLREEFAPGRTDLGIHRADTH